MARGSAPPGASMLSQTGSSRRRSFHISIHQRAMTMRAMPMIPLTPPTTDMISARVANDVGGSRNPLRIQTSNRRLAGIIVDFLTGVMVKTEGEIQTDGEPVESPSR